MDTHERLRQLLNERGWTEYRLAKNCGLSESTIANIYRRNTVPSIATLEQSVMAWASLCRSSLLKEIWLKSPRN